MSSQKSGKNNSVRNIFIKIIIKINIIKIYTKNTHFITTKCNIARILIKKSKPSSENRTVQFFLIILLVTKQSEISSNDARELSTASWHILWAIYLSGQYTIKEGYKETTKSHISSVLYWLGVERNTKKIYELLYYTSLESYSIQEHI